MKRKYFLLFLFLACLNVFSQNNKKLAFEQTFVDTIENRIDSILLIGIGSSATRIFLDDLSQHLKKNFMDDRIETKYHYAGIDLKKAKADFDTINKQGFKAILCFLPNDPAVFEVQAHLTGMSVPSRFGPITYRRASSSILYQQGFDFQLHLPSVAMKKIWAASVDVSGEAGKSKRAKQLGDKLYACFKANNYLR